MYLCTLPVDSQSYVPSNIWFSENLVADCVTFHCTAWAWNSTFPFTFQFYERRVILNTDLITSLGGTIMLYGFSKCWFMVNFMLSFSYIVFLFSFVICESCVITHACSLLYIHEKCLVTVIMQLWLMIESDK